jgi:hypothetical protein
MPRKRRRRSATGGQAEADLDGAAEVGRINLGDRADPAPITK